MMMKVLLIFELMKMMAVSSSFLFVVVNVHYCSFQILFQKRCSIQDEYSSLFEREICAADRISTLQDKDRVER